MSTILAPEPPRPVSTSLSPDQPRLVSLDVFRGITMFLLIAEGAGIYDAVSDSALNETLLGSVFTQFHHHPWNGLRFWDHPSIRVLPRNLEISGNVLMTRPLLT
jgi:predicted acyltransferase